MDTAGPCDVFPALVSVCGVEEARRVVDGAAADGSWSVACEEGRTVAFYIAARRSEEEALELWERLMSQIDVSAFPAGHLDVYEQTPIFYAAREGHLRLLRVLTEPTAPDRPRFDPRHLDSTRQTALFYACREGHDHVIRYLVETHALPVDHVDLNGDTALFYAARDNRESTCRLMITLGADCGFRNKYKYYASTIARKMGHRKLAGFLEQWRKSKEPAAAAAAPASPPPQPPDSAATKVPSDAEDAASAEPKKTARRRPAAKRGAPQPAQPADDHKSSPKKKPAPDPPKKPPAERDLCCLQYMSPLTGWSHTPHFRIQEFESLYPELAVWDASMTNPVRTLESDPYRTEWHRLATEVMRHLCNEVDNAHYFREPVDVLKWSIPDYYDVVKKPMDFGTILTNLEVGVEYATVSDFLHDLNLVFDNCILYNGPDSPYGKIAQSVRETAFAYAKSIGLKELAAEPTTTPPVSSGGG